MFICMREIRKSAWLGIWGGSSAMILAILAICVHPLLTVHATMTAPNMRAPLSRVPFVGCKSDGQLGPLDAPTGKSKLVPITAELAQQLAYYQSEQGGGVLAPRGWYCFETYGSDGGNLYVTPQPVDTKAFFSDAWSGFSGPALQLSISYGGTSGRFEVAHIIARAFPAHRAFVRSVIKEGIDSSSSFASGPYPQDKLIYKNKEIVEYQTPPNAEGLGTNSHLHKNGSPISGVAILAGVSSEPSLWLLSTRLPSSLVGLSTAIIQQVERDAAGPDR
jgi:hypothetical protein